MKSILANLREQKRQQRRLEIDKDLLHFEAKLGGQLFGPIPKGHRREFFCLDTHTWIWHEEWIDANGKRQIVMTRYDVRPGGILKSQGGYAYQKLEGQEAENFYNAVDMYVQRICGEYSRVLQPA